VEIRIRIVGAADPQAEVRSLHDWLKTEQDLEPSKVTAISPPVQVGHMGAALDVVTVALGGGGAVSVLAGSLGVWLRNRGTDIRCEITGPQGKIVVDAKRARDPAALIQSITKAVGEQR
jgi:hypothetical protein